MNKKSYSPNDMRSIVMNPTSRAHSADQANRANQASERERPESPPTESATTTDVTPAVKPK